MLALITVSKGSSEEVLEGGVGGCEDFSFSWARYFSERTAISPRTAYWAALTLGLILSMLRARGFGVVDILRRGDRCRWLEF